MATVNIETILKHKQHQKCLNTALELNIAPRSKGLQLSALSSRRVDQADLYLVKLSILNGMKIRESFLEVNELMPEFPDA